MAPMMGNAFSDIVTPRGAGGLRGRRRFDDGGAVTGMGPPPIDMSGLFDGGLAVPQVARGGPGAIIEPIRKPISPGTLSPPDNVFAPAPDIGPFGMAMIGQEAGGEGGGMARGGAIRMEEGGDVSGGDSDPSAGGGAPGQDADTGAYGSGLTDTGFGSSSMGERGLIGLAASLAGLPGIGIAASLAEALANYAESKGLTTDRDRTTGISAGGTQGGLAGPGNPLNLGHFGPGVSLQGGPSEADYASIYGAPQGGLTQPGAQLPALNTALPQLPALNQPAIDSRTYGYGSAAAWLR